MVGQKRVSEVPQFNDEWIEQVKQATDIVALISEKVNLKPTGKNYTGLCPFHEEKTPSFSVNPDKQFFYCFGCGAGGNAFNFVMRTENLSFPEAARVLAAKVGIEAPVVSETERKKLKLKEELFRVNRLAAKYFYHNLRAPEGSRAREYLASRDIDGSLARQFFLGYALGEWDGLLKFLESNGISTDCAEQAGLVIKGKRGYYDRFRDRIIFPICDSQGRFVGFGGRALGNEKPKYLNTPETPVFHKSYHLYGLNWAKEEIKREQRAVIVEGYTDCIALKAQGVTNVVASLGTAFTENHARLLANFTEEIIIAFDGDTAGERATERGLILLHQAGLRVKVASLPRGEDPDSFAKSRTKGEVREWLTQALPLWEYQIRRIISQHDINNREGKVVASQEIISLLLQIENAIEREEYLNFAAEVLDLPAESLREEINKRSPQEDLDNKRNIPHITPKNRYTIKDTPKRTIGQVPGRDTVIERDIMRWVLAKPSLTDQLIALGFGADDFANNQYRHLFRLLLEGTWDREGETTAEALYQLKSPIGRWEEYLRQFQSTVWTRELMKIEENLTQLENKKSVGLGMQKLCRLLLDYYQLKNKVLASLGKSTRGPLGRGD